MGRDSLAWDSLSRKLWCIKNLQKFEKVKKNMTKNITDMSKKLSRNCPQNCPNIASEINHEVIHEIAHKIVPKCWRDSPVWGSLCIVLIFWSNLVISMVFLSFWQFFGNFCRILAIRGILLMDRESLAWDSLSRKLWCIKNLQKFEKVKKTRLKKVF